MIRTADEILKTDRKRMKMLASPYDPLSGEGSPLPRRRLQADEGHYAMLPEKMFSLPLIKEMEASGSIASYADSTGMTYKEAMAAVTLLRMAYDFEYWCATCVKVQDKLTKRMVPFVLRRPQLKLFAAMIEDLFADRPVRIILLKARQWGGSTLVQIFMAWIQLFHRRRWHSAIVADIEDQSRNIKAMYSRLAANHPREVSTVTFVGFEGSSKNKRIAERDCIIYLGSMQKPDAIRSADVMMAHLSEVGLWRQTDGKRPEDVVQSIAGTVPLEPYSVIVMESTAKGIGNYFHRQWCKAVSGESGYKPVFVPWFEIELYSLPFKDEKERRAMAESLTSHERHVFELGATLEAINWYRRKRHTDAYDDWRMGCEFPSDPTEAFQSTGRRAHNTEYVSDMRRYVREPIVKGDMSADAPHGKGAIDSSLRFVPSAEGPLWIWAHPDRSTAMSRRYIVSMDIGGRTPGADWSVISVIDRYWLAEGGVEECIATCRFHLDQDLAVWKAVQIARYYCDALLVVEANSLDDKGSEGDHTLTILDEIKGHYTNLYCRTDPQRIREGAPERYGFFTSSASKSDLVNQMNKRLRESGYIEHDARALDEADTYEIKPDGSYGAVDGEHDDIYMSRAIALKASQTTPPPAIITPRENTPTRDTLLTEASF
ncbi:MAG: hypothetical protein K2L01_04340 [Rikenellaceae bacterium]|nr:hypothetical protein [Rikenellaceae bacterium]